MSGRGRRRGLVVAAALAVAVTGCGDESSAGRTSAVFGTSATSDAPMATVTAPVTTTPAERGASKAVVRLRRSCGRAAAATAVKGSQEQRVEDVSGLLTLALPRAAREERPGLVALRGAYEALRAAVAAAGEDADAVGQEAVLRSARGRVDAVAASVGVPECALAGP